MGVDRHQPTGIGLVKRSSDSVGRTQHLITHVGPAQVCPAYSEKQKMNSEAVTNAAYPPDVQFRLSDQVVASISPGAGPEGEAISALRTQLISQHLKDGRRALALCSPSRAGRSSFVAVNLAVALAHAGVKTLLIDANMREPAVHDYLVPSQPVLGLSECLVDPAVESGDAIQANVLPSLSVLFAGAKMDAAQEELAGPRFKSLVDVCLREFDVTIFDTAPTNSCSDAQIVGMLAHYALVVARKDHSYVNDIQTIIRDLRSSRVEVIGTVINDT